jgi:hypothetical protein
LLSAISPDWLWIDRSSKNNVGVGRCRASRKH